jgi:4-hydroxy-L-threonine phosphate dehydrogenase PdxA
MKNKPIIIVSGEPKSVFLEILFKALKKKIYKSPLILICCNNLLNEQLKKFKLKKKIRILDIKKLDFLKLDNKSINLINVKLKIIKKGNNNKRLINNYINKCFNIGFNLIKKNFTYKFINGPINKNSFLKNKYLGITELISKTFNQKQTGMLIFNKKLSVSPLTTHLPLKLVSKNISKKIISDKIDLVNTFFLKKIKINPKIAITGMNPHCESILKYNEDIKLIYPIVKQKRKEGVDIKGPYSADTIFLKENRKNFNVIIGIYHDQVLAPFKSLFEYDAINITMGLPFFRVTPDHGPNEKMFGKNKSNPKSLINCLGF